MRLPQIYETTVTSYAPFDEELALHAVVIPKRSWSTLIGSTFPSTGPLAAMHELGIRPHCTISSDRLAQALTAVLSIEGPNDPRINMLDLLITQEPRAAAFAQLLVREAFVPFEGSLELKSLEAILKMTSGAQVGAALGFYAGHGNPLLLVILVPTAIVLCGAAFGVSRALEEGLRKRILSHLEKPLRAG